MIRIMLALFALSIPSTAHSAVAPKQAIFDGIGPATYDRQEHTKRKAKVVVHTWEHQGPIGTFRAVYSRSDLRLPYRHGDTVAQALATSGGNLESSSHFQMDVETGLDVIIALPDSEKILRLRIVADGLREIRLTYIGPRNNPPAAEVDRFFNGIRFLD